MSRESTTRLSRIPAFLALQKSTIGLLIMVILVDMGERMAERFLPIYPTALGGGALSIGFLGAMDKLCDRLCFCGHRNNWILGFRPGNSFRPILEKHGVILRIERHE